MGFFSETECKHCGSRDHASDDCPHDRGFLGIDAETKCKHCGSKEHASSDCPHDRGFLGIDAETKCKHCGSTTHASHDCTHDRGFLGIDAETKCKHCGSKEHASSDCPHDRGFLGMGGGGGRGGGAGGESKESSDDTVKSVVTIGIFCFVVYVVYQVLKVTVVLCPIWLGALCLGAIAGCLLATRAAGRISRGDLSKVELYEEPRGKGKRLRIDPAFLKKSVTFGSDLVIISGISFLFGTAMAAWPFLANQDQLTQVALGVAVLAGTICGTLAGRRTLFWQLENLLFKKASKGSPTQLVVPGIAVGFAIPGSIVLISYWFFSMTQSSPPLDVSLIVGLKSDNQKRVLTSVERRNTDPHPSIASSQSSQQPLGLSFGPSTGNATTHLAIRPEAPTNPVTKLRSVGETDVRAFVTERIATEHSRNLNRIMGQYADRVVYWDNGSVTQDFIRKNKSEYFAAWPRSGQEIVGPIAVSQNDDGWEARFRLQFTTENPAKGIARDGLMEVTYFMKLFDGSLKVTLEAGKPLQQSKRALSQQSAPMANVGGLDNNRLPGERFPETRLRALNANDLNPMPVDAIRYAINEMYARRGADFKNEDIRRTFSAFSWYQPVRGRTYDQTEALFTALETANLKMLGEMRDARKNGASPVGAGSLPQIGNSPLPPVASPNTNGPRYSGKGRIYKTSELKQLVGQKFSNAWLQGDFLLDRVEGNTGHFITATVFLGGVVGGRTQVQIVFSGGVQLSPEGRNALTGPNRSVVRIKVPSADPAQLTSVVTDREGIMTVKALLHTTLKL